MEWSNEDYSNLETIDYLKLNPNQQKFIRQMEKFAKMGIIPTPKQRQFIKFLAKAQQHKN